MSDQSSRINLEVNGIKSNGGVPMEITVGENKDHKYLMLPLNYNFEFTPADNDGKQIPITSIVIQGTQTVIKTPDTPSRWQLTVSKKKPASLYYSDQSPQDETGTAVTVDPGEDEDGFTWLRKASNNLEDTNRKDMDNAFQTAKRKIVFQVEK